MVEGISQNRGDLAPLDQIFKLKEKFKYRLVLDESLSFGVLGATGRGAAEHFGLMPGQVEIVAASMGRHTSQTPKLACRVKIRHILMYSVRTSWAETAGLLLPNHHQDAPVFGNA